MDRPVVEFYVVDAEDHDRLKNIARSVLNLEKTMTFDQQRDLGNTLLAILNSAYMPVSREQADGR